MKKKQRKGKAKRTDLEIVQETKVYQRNEMRAKTGICLLVSSQEL
jgi:hypothetical protein